MPENLHYFTDGKSLKSIDLPQYPDSAWNWITGAPEDTKDEELYSRVAAVYRVANLSAEAIANVPFAVLKGETEYDTSDDWQNKVGFLPNIRELLRLWRLSLFMTNSAYGFMEGNRVSKNLRYVVPSTITPQIDKWEGLTGFKRSVGTDTTEYSLKDNRIFWMWRLDHTTELLPSKNSEFRALMAAAGVLYYADYYVQNFFQRCGIRPALLQVAGVPTREEREKIESVWDKIIHGWSKYLGKVISANEMDVKVIGDGIDNVANGQIHSEKLADVAMAAGMPLSIILANSANYATAQTEYLVWFRDSVVPWANYMQDELNDKLFTPLGLRFEFRPEMSDKGQEEERQRAGAYRAYVASGMKPSIAAQVVGIDLPPDIEYEDLDDVFVQPKPAPVNETEIPIEKEELPEPVDEKSVTLLTIDQLRELEHWQDLAFRKLKQGKSLAFPWVSKTLPEEVASVIRDRLPACKSQAEIERAFDLNMPDTPDRQLRELADALNRAVEVVVAEVKYDPNQPRVPAGHSDGGQWTGGGGGGLDGQNEYQVFNDRFGKPFKVYKIKDASDFLGGKYSIFVVNVKDGSIIAAEFSEGAWHADLVRFVDPDHTVDDYVRGYVLTNVDKGLSFSTVYAGVEFRNLNDRAGENRAIDNIYKALDRLVSKGLPKNTKVTINMLDGKELFTTAKSLKYSPDQPRVPSGSPDGGQWTDLSVDEILHPEFYGGSLWDEEETSTTKPRTAEDLALDIQAFNKWAYQWTGGVDYDAKVGAYEFALSNKELHEYLLKQEYGENIPKFVTVYRVGTVEEGVVSFFSTLGAAEGYAERFGENINSFKFPTEYIVPTMSGAGEVWFDMSRWAERSIKYDPNQPRVPAGNSDGGQWTDGDETGDVESVEVEA